jgi:hypothetical protein
MKLAAKKPLIKNVNIRMGLGDFHGISRAEGLTGQMG